jgi:hypothetical protein
MKKWNVTSPLMFTFPKWTLLSWSSFYFLTLSVQVEVPFFGPNINYKLGAMQDWCYKINAEEINAYSGVCTFYAEKKEEVQLRSFPNTCLSVGILWLMHSTVLSHCVTLPKDGIH